MSNIKIGISDTEALDSTTEEDKRFSNPRCLTEHHVMKLYGVVEV
jgi:hypothetical protein